ncbi:Uncharacterised protein [Chryseobacterium taihuense]|uniref:Uncharacterized protein n=1 Tax=Chryseobacterium taihuense TaxID=1141221 RepID=A0A4U8W8J8_9FLAO|nr:Uncharacterised protein [Chryseobacterium taihuense]
MKLFKDGLKLIVIMYIFILSKILLQLVFGYVFSIETDIKFYKIFNIQKSVYTIDYVLFLTILYECIIFVIAYFLFFLILYFIVVNYGNKLWLHSIYFSSIYVIIIFAINYRMDDFNIFYLSMMFILGVLNWYLFKKWIIL